MSIRPAGRAAGRQPARGVVPADPADTGRLSQVIADAFHDLPPSRWLIPDPAARRRDLPRLLPDLRRARPGQRRGAHHPRPRPPRRCGCPPAAPASPRPGLRRPAGRRHRPVDRPVPGLRRPWNATTRPVPRTTTWPSWPSGRTARARAPAPRCCAPTTPASTRAGMPAYLEASDLRTRRLYLACGYDDHGLPIPLAGAAAMYPMWRKPRELY